MNTNETVFFDADTLIEGRTQKLIYKGSLLNGNPEDIYIHFGYGLLWENLQEIKMTKIEEGYETTITFASSDSINFCFHDNNNNWDNNEAQNYIYPIEKEEVVISKVEPAEITTPRLKKSYLIMKKIKLAFYKVVTFIPRLISGNTKNKKIKEV